MYETPEQAERLPSWMIFLFSCVIIELIFFFIGVLAWIMICGVDWELSAFPWPLIRGLSVLTPIAAFAATWGYCIERNDG